MVEIRKGRKEDLPAALDLIRELAVFERAGDQVETTVQSMEKDGFGPDSLFEFFVAQKDDDIVGISLYYFRYSTWKGRRLYLEDLIVSEDHRGEGIGKLLFEATGREAVYRDCTGMVWQVLNWNEDAIKFYESYGAELDGGWLNCSIDSNNFHSTS